MKLKSVDSNNIIDEFDKMTVESDNDIARVLEVEPNDNIQEDTARPLSRSEIQTEHKRFGRYSSIDIMSNHTISVASAGFTIPSYFSVDVSTEENYSADDMEFYGSYDCIRKTLDYSYHGMIVVS